MNLAFHEVYRLIHFRVKLHLEPVPPGQLGEGRHPEEGALHLPEIPPRIDGRIVVRLAVHEEV